jgi:hypothetical protein
MKQSSLQPASGKWYYGPWLRVTVSSTMSTAVVRFVAQLEGRIHTSQLRALSLPPASAPAAAGPTSRRPPPRAQRAARACA